MSFILDALRKSESERLREAAPGLARAPIATVRHRTPPWIWVLIAVLSAALVALGYAWLGRAGTGLAPSVTDQVSPPDPAPVTTPSAQGIPTDSFPASVSPDTSPIVQEDDGGVPEAPIRPIADLAVVDASLPGYRLELIAYNSRNPAEGSAWINGRRYYVGERVGQGPEISEVRADAVVLAYRGSRFLLTTR
jgi:hypothetical protein